MDIQRVEQIKAEAVEWLMMLKDPDTDPDGTFPTRKALWTAFSRWYTQSPEHLAAFTEAADIDEVVRQISRARTRPWSIAVAIVTAIFLGLLIRSTGAWPTHYSTGIGVRTLVPLEDSSTVELNTRTRLVVSYKPNSREVTLLAGEAIFDVLHDSTRPFRVRSGDIVIEDIGTKFDVYRHADGTTSITVLDGSVDISRAADRERVDANQLATVSIRGGRTAFHLEHLSREEIERRLSWQTEWLRFEGETVAQGIEDINRYNRRKLVLDDPELASKQLGGQVRAVDLDSFVESLELTLGVRAVSSPDDPNTIHLRRGPRSP